jgi:phosphoribosylaminoimidazole-succinocarboxamide synthase
MTESIALPHFHSGKVRDTYLIPDHPDMLLMVASDRISTHNVPHASTVPSKGELLTAQTIFWDNELGGQFDTHILEVGQGIYRFVRRNPDDPRLHLRAMVVRRVVPDPREFIWRSYLTGSLAAAYQDGKVPYGIKLPEGLLKMHRFDKPLFTPTRKSEKDEPVNAAYAWRQFNASALTTKRAYAAMQEHLVAQGIALIDAKFEASGGMLIDEWGTGDCCRFAWLRDIVEGQEPPWLDKEVFRQAAVRQWGTGPRVPLVFDESVTELGVRRYHEAFEAITGQSLADFQHEFLS